ncbi:MAG: MerR family transcriptional regulator [Bacteroidetes bacterium]|nr:MerR family transcriptional regulator [Bacteroidota bacterium]
MSTEPLIPMDLYCRHEELDITFVQALTERGLIHVVMQEERSYIASDQLARLEQLARMHFDLDINLEGIEAISHMLERVDRMQQEMRALQERLRVYERE